MKGCSLRYRQSYRRIREIKWGGLSFCHELPVSFFLIVFQYLWINYQYFNNFIYLVISENNDIVDFTGEPLKYFGIQGKIIEVIGLKLHAGISSNVK